MTFDEIEQFLGAEVVSELQNSIQAALAVAEERGASERGADAVRELLIVMLAAVVINPIDGAEARAAETTHRFSAIVHEALVIGSEQPVRRRLI